MLVLCKNKKGVSIWVDVYDRVTNLRPTMIWLIDDLDVRQGYTSLY